MSTNQTFKRVIAHSIQFDYESTLADAQCKAHAGKVMGVDPVELSVQVIPFTGYKLTVAVES